MPFCDIDKDVSLHYITNTPNGDASDLDRTKHTIILLPPIFGAVDFWLKEQFKDARLSKRYNLIAFDQRNMGLTKSPLVPERDAWVDAADLALAHEKLQLPPCHVFAIAMNSCNAAMKFATLWPTKCLSLCLVHPPVQAGEDPEWLEQGYAEFVEAYCFPADLETLERACMEFSWFAFSGVKVSTELEDETVAWWQMNIPTSKRTTYLAQTLCALQRSRISDIELHSIKQPTIFIQGEKSFMTPPEKAQDLCDKMPRGQVFIVKGGPQLLTYVPEYASVVNRVYTQFLSGLSNDIRTPPPDPARANPIGVCKVGLKRLAALLGDTSIADLDPSTPLSFSRLTPETVAQNVAQFAQFEKGQSEAVHALDETGRPLRKFSERHRDEWKPAAFHRMMEEGAHAGHFVTVRTSSTYREEVS